MSVEHSEKGTILIVDDNLTYLEGLFDYLTDAGFKVLLARDGESAIRTVNCARPDVILLDIIMPGIDGFETCRRLKVNGFTKDIPVIFMTALSQTAVVVSGFQLGAVDYIIKPIQQEILLARVTTHLTIQKLQHNLQKQNAQLQQEIQQRQQAESALQEANQELQRLASVDGLTQLANRRRFDEGLSLGWRISVQKRLPLSLLLCDVDCFKLYNDSKGHLAGDECLQQVAQAMKHSVKHPADLVARYGGEEFAVILLDTTGEVALQVAQKIRLSVRTLAIAHPKSPISEYITLSLGVSCTVPCHESAPEELIAAADQALYQAKESGRDRAVFVGLSHNSRRCDCTRQGDGSQAIASLKWNIIQQADNSVQTFRPVSHSVPLPYGNLYGERGSRASKAAALEKLAGSSDTAPFSPG